ncbi:MAG: Gfo/Idh/MocA family oxidoreductase [Candidatus Helarchaeota archaeon]
MVNIAIIGSGIWARMSAEIYSYLIKKSNENKNHIPEIKLLGHWSDNQAIINEFQKKFRIEKTYNSIDEVLDDDDIDLIEICGPEENRSKIAIKSIKKGKHLSIAPPPGLNLNEISKLIYNIKKSNSKLKFRIINPLKNSFQFHKILDFVKEKKLGKVFTVNIASFSSGNPELNLFGDVYSVAEIINSLLGKIELIFGWTPEDLHGKFTNKKHINCNFVPKNKSKHGTWTHHYLPNLKLKSEFLYSEYTLDLVCSHSLLFSYGAVSELFNNSPISSGPGIYWCHQKDHTWKSIFNRNISHKDIMISNTVEFINSIIEEKKLRIDCNNILNSSQIINCIIFSILNNGDPIKIKDAPINILKILEKGGI